MKRILIGLLFIAAAATGAYYLLKEKKPVAGFINKELLVGKWKIDSLVAADSTHDNIALLILATDSNFLIFLPVRRENGKSKSFSSRLPAFPAKT